MNKIEVSTSEKEVVLLEAINKKPQVDIQNRYAVLSRKLHEEKMTPTENKELLKIIEILEAHNVERLRNLIELSKLKNVSLNSLMDELNFHFHG